MEIKDDLEALFNYATEGIIITDREGSIIKVNPSANKMFGYTANELVTKKVEVLIPSKFASKHISHRENFQENPHARAMGGEMDLYGRKKKRGRVSR